MVTGVPLLDLEQVPPTVYITRGQCEPRTICLPDACPLPMRRSVTWCVEDFHLHKQLYKGKASLLYSATCRLSNTPIALKLYRKEKLSNLNWFQVEREIRIHSQLRHENIIQLFAAFEDSDNVYLAQELAEGGDLYEDLKTNGGKIDEARVASRIIYPCMQALAYLHKMGIIHRDIKSENILLTADRTVKLADFGLSINHREERPVTRAGTLDMMAPEVLVCPEKSRPEENKERAMLEYTDAVDAWAIGIVAFELLVGHPPFEKESRSETYEHIMYRAPVMPMSISSSAKSFITAALVKAVSKRPSVDQLLGHSWLHHHLQLPAARTTEVQSNSEQKKAELSTNSVSITIDCTVGITPSTSVGSNASSSGSADTLEVFKAETTEPLKSSVLQWAGSSLKTITKKLRKTSIPPPGCNSQLPMQQDASAPEAASASLPVPASSDFIQGPPPRLQPLQILVPAAHHGHYAEKTVAGINSSLTTGCSRLSSVLGSLQEASVMPESPQMLHFVSLAAATEPAASPRHSMTARQPSRLRSAQVGSLVGPRQASFRMLKPPPPPPVTRSLASLCLGEREGQTEVAEGHRRRSLLATKAGLEAQPPSPPAYLSRPWTTKRVPRSVAELPATSPISHPPSPLARRRRRLAGNNDTSSSGSLSLADTPKGGHFPSGPKSARAFGRPGNYNHGSSPGNRMTGDDGKQLRMHNSPFLLGKSNQWTALSPTRNNLTARAEQGSQTLPRDMGNPMRDPASKRAASATPGALPVARKLSLESQRAV